MRKMLSALSVFAIDYPLLANPWEEPAAAILDSGETHNSLDRSTGRHYPPELLLKIAKAVDNFIEIEKQYYKAAARYLAGSGNDINGTMPGISLHQEPYFLTRIGLSEREALAAATSNFAEIFKWNEVGQIKPGCRADIIVVDKDPLETIENLKQISMVMLRGKIIDRDGLLEIGWGESKSAECGEF